MSDEKEPMVDGRAVATGVTKWLVISLLAAIGALAVSWWTYVKSLPIPPGSVVAFASSSCPEIGWERFDDAQGRFIIGWTDDLNLPSQETRAARPFDDVGGEEHHQLTIDEMPEHSHSYMDNSYAIVKPISRSGEGGHDDVKRETGSEGKSQPHNNMPPFIALTYCLKK